MVAQMVKNLTAMQETWVQSLGREDSLEKGMAYPLQYSGLEIIETKYTIHVRNENDPKTVPTHLSPCKKCLPLNWPLVLKKLGSTAVSYENGMEARVGGYCCCHSITKSCLTHCGPMDGSMPGFPVHQYLPEFAQTHAH